MKRKTGFLAVFTAVSILTAAECNADSYGRLIQRGNRYFKSGLYDEALDNYVKGEEKTPGVFEPVFNRADALYKEEDYRGAIDAFERSLSLSKRRHEKADIYYNLGNSRLMVGDYDEAIESYIRGLELNPANLNMKYNLELALERRRAQDKKDSEREEEKGPPGGEKTPETGDSKEDSPADDPPETDEEKGNGQAAGNGQSDGADHNPRELSKAEAERLLTSVSSEQARIINDIINERIQGEESEKDW